MDITVIERKTIENQVVSATACEINKNTAKSAILAAEVAIINMEDFLSAAGMDTSDLDTYITRLDSVYIRLNYINPFEIG